MKTFLDLPAEIRNIIYKLVSDLILNSESKRLLRHRYQYPHPQPHQGLIIRFQQAQYAHIPPITRVCRQIQTEFLSQELPRYTIEGHSATLAHCWDHHVSRTLTVYLRKLTFRICFSTNVSERATRTKLERLRKERYLIPFHARYRDVPGAEAMMQFKFNLFPESMANLDEGSKDEIRRTLLSLLSSDTLLTVRTFVLAVHHISKLNLQHSEIRKSVSDSYFFMKKARYDFSLTEMPRCLHEEERGTYVDWNMQHIDYRMNVVDTFEELPNDLADQ